jgi:hypothetical protein
LKNSFGLLLLLLLLQLWEMCCDGEGNPQVRYVSSLSGHSRTINCVRFSHSGEHHQQQLLP